MHTAQVGADLFDMELADFATQIEVNFERLFSKVSSQQATA
jgi:TatD DNase family protein